MLFCNVDEFSLVIKLKNEDSEEVNKENFEMLFNAIVKAFALSDIFGEPEKKSGAVGYTDVYGFANKIRLSYNPKRSDMGLYMWVSATGLLDLTISKQLDFWGFFERLSDLCLTLDYLVGDWHYSRLDFTADFVDEGQSVNDLYKSIKTGDTNFYTRYLTKTGEIKLRDTKSRVTAYENDGIANTLYIGSRKANSNFLLRIYNKKQEQLDSDAPYHIDQAKNCKDWVRYEYSFRKDYAKAIKSMFDGLNNAEIALKELARKALDRVTFYELDRKTIDELITQGKDFVLADYMDITYACNMIDGYANSNNELFRLPSKQVNELYDTYQWHINNDSGIISFLYKIDEIYGYQGIKDFFKRLELAYLSEDVKPSEDAIRYVDEALRRKLDETPCPWALDPNDNMKLLKMRKAHLDLTKKINNLAQM